MPMTPMRFVSLHRPKSFTAFALFSEYVEVWDGDSGNPFTKFVLRLWMCVFVHLILLGFDLW